MSSEALPMQANDAEVSLLGAAMSGADIDEIAGLVTSADFYHPARGQVWDAVCRVHAAGNKPDPVSVRFAMEKSGDRHDPLELLRMTELSPVVSSAPFYAEQVAMAAGHRAITAAGTQLHALGAKVGDLDEHREMARQIVDDACRGRSTSRARRLADIVPAVLDVAQHGHGSTLSTPWPDLDEFIGGIAPGRLIVVGARPGIGKSILGTNLALHVAHRHGHAAHVASMEMPEDEVVARLIAAHARVNLTSLMTGATDEASWQRIAAAHAEMDAMPLTIDDTPGQNVQHIRRTVRNVQRTRDDLALVVVDYLQLMDVGNRENRAQALGEVSRGLKLLARESGACVVALAQVNRESARRGDRPRMSDLRESGAIEADADQVVLMHQPDEQLAEIEVIVDKNRHGPKGIRHLLVAGHYARLTSATRASTYVPEEYA